jgi:hypothetical protein
MATRRDQRRAFDPPEAQPQRRSPGSHLVGLLVASRARQIRRLAVGPVRERVRFRPWTRDRPNHLGGARCACHKPLPVNSSNQARRGFFFASRSPARLSRASVRERPDVHLLGQLPDWPGARVRPGIRRSLGRAGLYVRNLAERPATPQRRPRGDLDKLRPVPAQCPDSARNRRQWTVKRDKESSRRRGILRREPLNYAPQAQADGNRRLPALTPVHFDKLGVTGSSQYRP